MQCELCGVSLEEPHCEIYGHKVCHVCYRTLVNMEYDAEAQGMTVKKYITSILGKSPYSKKVSKILLTRHH